MEVLHGEWLAPGMPGSRIQTLSPNAGISILFGAEIEHVAIRRPARVGVRLGGMRDAYPLGLGRRPVRRKWRHVHRKIPVGAEGCKGDPLPRSEERRVGKECRSRWS